MDAELKHQLQVMERRLSMVEGNAEGAVGRALALEVALNATVRSFGMPATVALSEVTAAFERAAASALRQRLPLGVMREYERVRKSVTGSIQAAVDDSKTQ